MAFRRRDRWADFMRRHAAELRSSAGRFVSRPSVRSRIRVGAWTVVGILAPVFAVCLVMAFWHTWRAHSLAGVPGSHTAIRIDGQPVHVRRGGPVKDDPKVPLTEEQFQAWEENDVASTRWARRMAALMAPGLLAALIGVRLSRPTPSATTPDQTASGPATSAQRDVAPAVLPQSSS